MSMLTGVTRRRLLQQASALAALAFVPGCREQSAVRLSKLANYPFPLGVASGDPITDGIVLWTRLAPDPFDPQAMPKAPVVVDWSLAEDENMSRIVRRGQAFARHEHGHSVHVDVRGLKPGREYFYRFEAAGEASPVGRTRTLPIIGSPAERLRFAFASCQHYEQGYFRAYRDMVEQDVDLILHLGDYIYERLYDGEWPGGVRRHPHEEAFTLDQYRAYHACYKLDPDLQEAHRLVPWAVTWDDHEVDNDYAGEHSEDLWDAKRFLRRRAAAYKAYFEHMPLRRIAMPQGPDMRLYQRLTYGDLVEFNLLDTRQHRSDQACPGPDNGAGSFVSPKDCPELAAPERTMLGEAQEEWLAQGYGRTGAKWNVLAQAVLFAPVLQGPPQESPRWSDIWDGYPAARARLLEVMKERKVGNPVVLTGDIHSFWVNDVPSDPANPASPAAATELVCTSVTSPGVPYELIAQTLPVNSHVKYFESRERGYVLCNVS
ncbi:MAG: alkaline phosphatase D family protein, partial [Alphaproteobacteria bacterium]